MNKGRKKKLSKICVQKRAQAEHIWNAAIVCARVWKWNYVRANASSL